MKTTRHRGTPDFILLVLTFLLVGFGVVMVFSASSATSAYHFNDPFYYTKRQIMWAVLGIAVMLLLMNIPYRKLRPLAFPAFAIVIVLLVLVLMRDPIYGSRRWLSIGPFGLQPSEFAKLGIILYFAHLISKKGEKVRDFQKGLLPLLIIAAITAGLIMMQPDFGATAIFLCCAMAVIIAGGVNLKHFFAVSLAGGSLAAAFISFNLLFSDRFEYIKFRVTSFLDPWQDPYNTGYNLIHSLLAFGHGGTFGAGIGQSIQKLHYLPFTHNDFILPVIGEELGFIGLVTFLLIYLFFFVEGIADRIAKQGSILHIGRCRNCHIIRHAINHQFRRSYRQYSNIRGHLSFYQLRRVIFALIDDQRRHFAEHLKRKQSAGEGKKFDELRDSKKTAVSFYVHVSCIALKIKNSMLIDSTPLLCLIRLIILRALAVLLIPQFDLVRKRPHPLEHSLLRHSTLSSIAPLL